MRSGRERSGRTTSDRQAGAAAPLQVSVQGLSRFTGLPSRRTLARWVGHARLDPEEPAVLLLRFVDAREGRRLNRTFRTRDYATNVLTFDYGRQPLWADIVLCVPVIRREAREHRRPVRDHLAHLVIHGLLHAQGHDHRRRREACLMENLERLLLAPLGVSDPYQESPASH